jgi:hypothetical protein
MKLRVQLVNGQLETLSLVPPLEIIEGTAMWRIMCGDGTDHYFHSDTGYYDGWGRALCGNSDADAAAEVINKFEQSREIEGQK